MQAICQWLLVVGVGLYRKQQVLHAGSVRGSCCYPASRLQDSIRLCVKERWRVRERRRLSVAGGRVVQLKTTTLELFGAESECVAWLWLWLG